MRWRIAQGRHSKVGLPVVLPPGVIGVFIIWWATGVS